MFFCSPLFLFIFLPTVVFCYALSPTKAKNTVLLIASLLFYSWLEPRFFPIVIMSAVADYFLCQKMINNSQKANIYLLAGIALNCALLGYYKYLNMFISAFHLQILVPIGISIIVFAKISYLIDIYRSHQPAKSLRTYLTYVFFFPVLLAGPIIPFHKIAAQFQLRPFKQDNFIEGFKRFLLGFTKKIVLADTLAELVNPVFALPIDQLGFQQAWLGLIAFSLQIYLNLSAYSDMAIGIARMFGFRIEENFNKPYLASNFTDFWQRWFISLSAWIREYVYYFKDSTLNIIACMLVASLWFGANWTFVLWGIYHGLFLTLEKLSISFKPPLTLLLITLGWVIFRTTSFAQMTGFFNALFHPHLQGTAITINANIWAAIAIGLVISLTPSKQLVQLWRSSKNGLLIENWTLSAVSFFAITRLFTSTALPFL